MFNSRGLERVVNFGSSEEVRRYLQSWAKISQITVDACTFENPLVIEDLAVSYIEFKGCAFKKGLEVRCVETSFLSLVECYLTGLFLIENSDKLFINLKIEHTSFSDTLKIVLKNRELQKLNVDFAQLVARTNTSFLKFDFVRVKFNSKMLKPGVAIAIRACHCEILEKMVFESHLISKIVFLNCDFWDGFSINAVRNCYLKIRGGILRGQSTIAANSELINISIGRGVNIVGEIAISSANYNSLKMFNLSNDSIGSVNLTDVKKGFISGVEAPNLSISIYRQSSEGFQFRDVHVRALNISGAFSGGFIALDSVTTDFFIMGIEANCLVMFSNCIFNIAEFSRSIFRRRTRFFACIFKTAPTFYSVDLYPDTNFASCIFKQRDAEGESAYRQLKQLMANNHNTIDEQEFSSLELECNWRGLDRKKEPEAWFFGFIYFLSNRFGQSIRFPSAWLVAFFLLGFLFYLFPGNVVFEKTHVDVGWKSEAALYSNKSLALWYSLINSSGPLKFHPSAQLFTAGNSWVLGFSIFHSLMATYFWFLIIVWLRRRFRTT